MASGGLLWWCRNQTGRHQLFLDLMFPWLTVGHATIHSLKLQVVPRMGSMDTPRWLTPDEQRTWRALVWSSQVLHESLDRRLQREAGMPHAYYIILVRI